MGSLQPSELFLLLGSGASVGMGYPTMDELGGQFVLDRVAAGRHPSLSVPAAVRDCLNKIDLFLRTYHPEPGSAVSGMVGIESVIKRANFYIEVLQEMATDNNFISYLFPTVVQRSRAGAMLRATESVRELSYQALHTIYSSPPSPECEPAKKNLANLYM